MGKIFVVGAYVVQVFVFIEIWLLSFFITFFNFVIIIYISNVITINYFNFNNLMKGYTIMNNIYFAIYNQKDDCIEVYTQEKLKIIFDCTRLNNNVFLEDPLDIAYLHRLAREEPFNYIYFALQPDGLQGYVEAMNVFN